MRIQSHTVACLLLCAGCSVQQENGNLIKLDQPFVLSGTPQWHGTQQATTQGGARVCTIASGELEVTLRYDGQSLERQVSTSSAMTPGDSYKVLVNDHVYETSQDWFSAKDSESIIADIQSASVVYTEMRKYTLTEQRRWRSVDNKIPTEGFNAEYQACEHFVKPPLKGRL